MVWRAASAVRFHLRQVDRFSPTAPTTLRPIASITSRGTSSARSSRGASFAVTVRAQWVASSPSRCDALSRHSPVRSASERTCFSGLVANVACARSLMTVASDGCLPCRATYSAMSRFFPSLICRDRDENSATNLSGTVLIAQAGLRSRPMSLASHSTPNARVRWSANTASWSSERATVAAWRGRPSRERHLPSWTICTLFEITTCVCRCGSPARES